MTTDKTKAALDAANAEIIKVAAILATGEYNVSDDRNEYSVKVPASVLHLIGKQNERMRTLANRLKKSSDVIRTYITAQAEAQPAEDDVREAVEAAQDTLDYWREELKSGDWPIDNCAPAFKFKHLETLIRAATAPKTTDVPCRTCKGDPETCADVPDARRVYGFHSGKALSCHPPGVESAIETFLRFDGAVFVDGKPVEKFGIATGAMSSAIQAYLDYYRNGVGDTDETRKSY